MAGGSRKKAAASVECKQQPGLRAEGVRDSAQAAGGFSPTWAAGRRLRSHSWTAGVQSHLLWPPQNAGMSRVDPPEEAPLPGAAAVISKNAWSPGAGRGADAIPSPLGRARELEPVFEA